MRGALAALAAIGLAGCQDADLADVDVSIVAQGALPSQVRSVVLDVSPGAGPAFEPFRVLASPLQGGWSASVNNVPSGAGRDFVVRALDAAGNALYAGSARAEVLPGVSMRLAVLLQDVGPPPGETVLVPVVRSVSVWNAAVDPGGIATLRVEADGAPGETLGFDWGVPYGCGEFDAPDQPATNWYAIGVLPGHTCIVTLAVWDSRSNTVRVSIPIDVR